MKKFGQIMRFEFTNYAQSKPYIIITVIFVLIIAVLLTYPRISALFKSGDGDVPQDGGERPVMALADMVYGSDYIVEKITEAFPGNKVVTTGESMDQLKNKVMSGDYASAVVIEAPLKFTYITKPSACTPIPRNRS